MNIKSRSAISFNELRDKVEDIHDFGNDWGLYIDIENDYNNQFGENSPIKQKKNYIFDNIEFDDDDDDDKKKNYFKKTKLFMTKLLFYICIVLGVTYIFEDKKI